MRMVMALVTVLLLGSAHDDMAGRAPVFPVRVPVPWINVGLKSLLPIGGGRIHGHESSDGEA